MRDVAACLLFSLGMHGLGQSSLVPLQLDEWCLRPCHMLCSILSRYSPVQSFVFGSGKRANELSALEEALQAQGLQSKASTIECSSRLYLSTTTISSSSKVNTAVVSSCLWSCMIYVFTVFQVALVAFRVRFCKHACGCDGIIVS